MTTPTGGGLTSTKVENINRGQRHDAYGNPEGQNVTDMVSRYALPRPILFHHDGMFAVI